MEYVHSTIRTQWGLVEEVWGDPRFHSPMLVIWVASFGGALHAPVTTFYLLKLGATSIDIGWMGTLAGLMSILLSPLYGHLLDTRGGYHSMQLSCFLCALGCLVRGLAINVPMLYAGSALLGLGGGNLWTVTLAYVAKTSIPERRSVAISGFLLQCTALRLLGKSLFPLFNFILERVLMIADELVRFRIVMGVCTFFCIFGCFELRRAKAYMTPVVHAESVVLIVKDDAQSTRTRRAEPGRFQLVAFSLLSAALVVQATSVAISNLLWPLFVRDVFGWGPNEFAWIMFGSSLVSTGAVAACPIAEKVVGRIRLCVYLTGTASFCSLTAFASSSLFASGGVVVAHVCLAIVLFACLAMLEPSLKSIASLFAPSNQQGRLFGVMATVAGLGASVGNIAGAYLYELRTADSLGLDLGKGVLPMGVVSMLLAAATLLIGFVGLRYHIKDRSSAPPSPRPGPDASSCTPS